MTETVSITVVCDSDGDGGTETFGVLESHIPELPKPCNEQLQAWVRLSFGGELSNGEMREHAAVMEYEPYGEIQRFRRT